MDQVAELRRCEALVRAGADDSVHRMRVAVRRLRSAYRDKGVRSELSWLAAVLGEPRDVEVLIARITELIAAEDPDNVRPEVVGFIERNLNLRLLAAREGLDDALDTKRYAALLKALDRVPPLAADDEHLFRDWCRLKRRVAAVTIAGGQEERETQLHEVRKAAKRLRYRAETVVPSTRREAKSFVGALKELQALLGDHHDAVVSQVELRHLSDAAAHEGIDVFTFGVLCAREATRAEETSAAFARVWESVNHPELRRWFDTS